MANLDPYEGVVTGTGRSLYRAESVADLLVSDYFSAACRQLTAAAAVIERTHDTGLEKYLKHFVEMGFVGRISPRIGAAARHHDMSVALGKAFLEDHQRLLQEQCDDAAAFQSVFPNALYKVQTRKDAAVVDTLQKVTGFEVVTKRGQALPEVTATFEASVRLTGRAVALCDVAELSTEIQDSLEPHFAEE